MDLYYSHLPAGQNPVQVLQVPACELTQIPHPLVYLVPSGHIFGEGMVLLSFGELKFLAVWVSSFGFSFVIFQEAFSNICAI